MKGAHGSERSDIVAPREDKMSISTEETLDRATSENKILQCLNGLVDKVCGRVRKH